MGRLLAWVILASAMLLSRAAPAQPARGATPQVGRVHFEAGTAYFQAGRFADAAREFGRAFEITGRVELLFNLGLASERAGDLAGALHSYERFEAAGAPGADRPELRSRIAALRARVAPAVTPAVTPVPSAAEPADRPSTGSWQRTLAWVSLGAGVVLLGGGAAALAVRESSAQDYNASFDRGLCLGADRDLAAEPATCRAARNDVGTWQSLAVAGFATGGALAVASLVLFVVAPRARSAPATHAAWACGQGPGEVGVRCRFEF